MRGPDEEFPSEPFLLGLGPTALGAPGGGGIPYGWGGADNPGGGSMEFLGLHPVGPMLDGGSRGLQSDCDSNLTTCNNTVFVICKNGNYNLRNCIHTYLSGGNFRRSCNHYFPFV